MSETEKKQISEQEETKNEQIREMGQILLEENRQNYRIHLLSIIGEVEGHEVLSANSKTTKYEHGLAIAEMVASMSKPSVSLVLGGGHSIGVPMAVSADYSYIVPSATMMIHPVRSNGMFIGVMQSYKNIEKIQERITEFVASHSNMGKNRMEELMLDTTQLVKDVGTMLDGKEAVKEGLIDEVGGISQAFYKLYELIEKSLEIK